MTFDDDRTLQSAEEENGSDADNKFTGKLKKKAKAGGVPVYGQPQEGPQGGGIF